MLFMFAVLTTTPKMHVYQQVALSEVECRRDAELTELQDGVGKRTFLSLLLSSCACVMFLLTSTVQPHFSLHHTLPNSQCAAAGRSQSLTRLRHASHCFPAARFQVRLYLQKVLNYINHRPT